MSSTTIDAMICFQTRKSTQVSFGYATNSAVIKSCSLFNVHLNGDDTFIAECLNWYFEWWICKCMMEKKQWILDIKNLVWKKSKLLLELGRNYFVVVEVEHNFSQCKLLSNSVFQWNSWCLCSIQKKMLFASVCNHITLKVLLSEKN